MTRLWAPKPRAMPAMPAPAMSGPRSMSNSPSAMQHGDDPDDRGRRRCPGRSAPPRPGRGPAPGRGWRRPRSAESLTLPRRPSRVESTMRRADRRMIRRATLVRIHAVTRMIRIFSGPVDHPLADVGEGLVVRPVVDVATGDARVLAARRRSGRRRGSRPSSLSPEPGLRANTEPPIAPVLVETSHMQDFRMGEAAALLGRQRRHGPPVGRRRPAGHHPDRWRPPRGGRPRPGPPGHRAGRGPRAGHDQSAPRPATG